MLSMQGTPTHTACTTWTCLSTSCTIPWLSTALYLSCTHTSEWGSEVGRDFKAARDARRGRKRFSLGGVEESVESGYKINQTLQALSN